MNLDNSEEGQMIGMEDDIVKNEDLGRRSLMGRKRVKRRNNKRKMKGRKKKGKKGKRNEKKGKTKGKKGKSKERKRKAKKGKRKEKEGKRKAKKGKGCRKGKPLSGNQGPTCSTNKDCGPYGLCNAGDFEKAKPKWVFIKRCTCYKTEKIRNLVLRTRTGPLWLD